MKIVVVGSGGRLGAALTRTYCQNFDLIAFDRSNLDLSNSQQIRRKLDQLNFDILVNAEGPKILAEICGDKKAKLIHFSTDYVFDGEKRKPYTEQDPAQPISVYGESKRAGEINVLALKDRHLIIRVSWVFGPERPSFIDAIIKRAQEEEQVDAVADKFSTPTYTSDIAEMLPQFFELDVPGGVLHFANAGECSWQEYAQHALDSCRARGIPLKAKAVGALKLADMKNWIARRPVYSVLSTAKYAKLTGVSPRSWRDAVSDYIERSYLKK